MGTDAQGPFTRSLLWVPAGARHRLVSGPHLWSGALPRSHWGSSLSSSTNPTGGSTPTRCPSSLFSLCGAPECPAPGCLTQIPYPLHWSPISKPQVKEPHLHTQCLVTGPAPNPPAPHPYSGPPTPADLQTHLNPVLPHPGHPPFLLRPSKLGAPRGHRCGLRGRAGQLLACVQIGTRTPNAGFPQGPHLTPTCPSLQGRPHPDLGDQVHFPGPWAAPRHPRPGLARGSPGASAWGLGGVCRAWQKWGSPRLALHPRQAGSSPSG